MIIGMLFAYCFGEEEKILLMEGRAEKFYNK